MRENTGIFRGKRKDNGEWVERYYLCLHQDTDTDLHIIVDERGKYNPVVPETVGEFTGLLDKNGKKIFEGDILKISEGSDEDDYVIKKVYSYRGVLCVDYWTPDWDFNALAFFDNDNGFVFEIVGNIHDNPELVEG